jgi:hypothetical protein
VLIVALFKKEVVFGTLAAGGDTHIAASSLKILPR